MSIQRATPVNEFLAKLIFLVIPTSFVAYFLLDNLNQYFTILKNDSFRQTIYFFAGMGLAALFHSFRFRFLPAFLLLIFCLYSVYKGLDNYAVGEFDAFFIARRFQIFAILFSLGWLLGWGFIRLRYWSVFIAAALLCGCIAVIAKSKTETVNSLMMAFSPAMLYSVYIVFAAEQIYNYKDKSKKYWWFLISRLVAFGILAILVFSGVTYLMRKQIEAAVATYGGQGKEGKNDMLNQHKDGTFSMKDYSRLRSSLGRSNELLFCAHIDNYFPGTTEPNPLYLTEFYFTKFDTATETFERDSIVPFNDLFEPDPSKLPLFTTKSDSSVIKNSLGNEFRKTVEMEVYCKKLSPETYLAPNVGFFVQPITIEKDFRQEFKSAFRAKSYVSELNSAYFVYNIDKPEVRHFQEMRNNLLRQVKDYRGVDSGFLRYYTKMPGNAKFQQITNLAHSIMDSASTPVDKVLAVRDYFLSKGDNGEPVYKYSDNPGEPDIPNASKLMYFLSENHKGYCAYFAGATLFLLRAMGIPSRIAVGFLTENRADKNKGWYWYYAKQAHAWVQVYFPGFGWLDFDTTVGNTDAHQSPSPDGTPPMQPPKAWLAADIFVEDVDTLKKLMKVSVQQFVFHDRDYKLTAKSTLTLDMKLATVFRDSFSIPLKTVQKGEQGTAVSYAEVLKNQIPTASETANAVLKRFPESVPIDEVYLKRNDVIPQQEQPKAKQANSSLSPKSMFWIFCGLILGVFIFMLSLSAIIFAYYRLRYKYGKTSGNKAYWAFRAACFYLHVTGTNRGEATPMHYAKSIVDPKFDSSFTGFMNVYLKIKYAKQSLNENEVKQIDFFLNPFIEKVSSKIPFKTKLSGFVNPLRCVSFYMLPEEED